MAEYSEPLYGGSRHFATHERMPIGERSWPTAYWLSAGLTVVLLVVAAGGLALPGMYRDPAASWIAQARGVNLVDVVVTVPTLIASMALSARGSGRARLVWRGALEYVLYNAVIFAFELAFNRFFLLYVGVLSLVVSALVNNLMELDVSEFSTRLAARAPRKSVSAYLVVAAALFLLAWMSEIVPAIVANSTPSSIAEAKLPTNPVYVLDLGFVIPLYILAAIWLLGRRPWGYLLAGVFLVLNTLLGLSIISSTLFRYANDQSTSIGVIPLFGIIALVSLAVSADEKIIPTLTGVVRIRKQVVTETRTIEVLAGARNSSSS